MTQRDRIMLSVVAVVAVLAATFMLGIKPKREEASTLRDQAAQAETRRDTALSALANAKQARAQYADAQVGIARLGKAVPADEDIATVVYQLERTARKAGIDFRALRYESGGTDPTPTSGAGTENPQGASASMTKVPFKLSFEGHYFQLRRFVNHVNSLTRMRAGKYVRVRGRLFSVEGVAMAAGRGGFPDIKASINVTAYTAPAPAAASAAAATGAAPAGSASGTTTASATTPSTATPASPTASGVAAE